MEKGKFEEYEFIGKGLYFPKKSILVITDLHIGWEEYLNKQGVFAPRMQFKEILEELKKLIERVNIKRKLKEIIILGDLKHEFGKISSQEWKETKEILDFLKREAEKIILIKGNHDNILGPIAKMKEIETKKFYICGEVCFLHGNKIFPECLDKKIKILVAGHRHPAIVLSDKYKKEKYKCFLVGEWKKKKVIILPSFFPFIEGSDIVEDYGKNKMFVPEKVLKNFEIYVVGDKIYNFGKLKSIV